MLENLPELLFIVSVVGTVHTVGHSGLPTQGLLASVHSLLEPGIQNDLIINEKTKKKLPPLQQKMS